MYPSLVCLWGKRVGFSMGLKPAGGRGREGSPGQREGLKIQTHCPHPHRKTPGRGLYHLMPSSPQPGLCLTALAVTVGVMETGWSPMTGSKTGWEVCPRKETAVEAQKPPNHTLAIWTRPDQVVSLRSLNLARGFRDLWREGAAWAVLVGVSMEFPGE